MAKKEISVLIVDDEEAFRYMLSALLTNAGFAVETAVDGVAAINAVQTKLYDVVLCDVKMPKVDGVELLRFVKANFPAIEVVMLTGMSDVKIAVECMRLGPTIISPSLRRPTNFSGRYNARLNGGNS